jgi:membrane-associated phospholipid phosphatase
VTKNAWSEHKPWFFALGVLFLVAAPAFDESVMEWVRTWNRTTLGVSFDKFAYYVGLGSLQVPALLVFCLWGLKRSCKWAKPTAIYGVSAFVASGVLTQIVKHLVGRPRPSTGLWPMDLKGPVWDSDFHSFPSGHTATSFALAAFLGVIFPKARPYLYVVSILVALGRVIGAAHHVSDVLAGCILGVLVGLPLGLRALRKIQGTDRAEQTV